MNKTQVVGIGIGIIGFATYLLTENNVIHTISGVLCAISLGFVFKWIPFKKQRNSNNG